MLTRRLLLAGVAVLAAASARAEVKLHPLFSDNMVLQRDANVTVWGTASPGEAVAVSVGDASAKTTADDKGNWSVSLPKLKAGTGHTLSVQGANEIALKNVAVGDVWLCSGQSNMEWRLSQLPRDDQGKKVAAAATNPNIRLFTVPNRPSAKPEADFPVSAAEGKWLECTPETVINFSAVGYFFGRDVQKAENVVVGLISSDWGGTSAQSWTSREALTAVPELTHYVKSFDAAAQAYDAEKAKAAYEKAMEKYKADAEKLKAEGRPAGRAPQLQGRPGTGPTTTTLFNGMIAPIVKFPITGAIWYQGESNAGSAAEYRTLLPTMIRDWRARWGYDFPFLIVQLAPFRGGASGVDYAELRDAQANTAKVLGRTAVAVITDAGEETDIHPQEKEPVGQRLALAARALAYGEHVEYSGPTFKDYKVEGDAVVVSFDHVGGGLEAKGEGLVGFQVCGEDRAFKPAKAEIKGDTVVVRSDAVTKPVAVRYGWVNFAKPELNFFNKKGLPAVPFRTDEFPLTTAAKK